MSTILICSLYNVTNYATMEYEYWKIKKGYLFILA